jgi:protein-tyrosine-phosphatase
VRWRLLRELGRGDLRVGELSERAGRRQSLVSYHLARLRSAGLVSARRSDADGRDTYYVLELGRCAELFSLAAGSLHPGLGMEAAAPDLSPGPPARVLFVCTGNSARSQIAAALCERLADGSVSAASAGTDPKPLHPLAVAVMRRRGVDIAGRRPRHIETLTESRFDFVVTLCDRAREVCPEQGGAPEAIHWSVPDPSAVGGGAEAALAAFERAAGEIETRLLFFLQEIQSTRTREVSARG